MTRSRNQLIVLAAAISCISFSYPAYAQMAGYSGGSSLSLDTLPGEKGSGAFGSEAIADIMRPTLIMKQALKWRDKVDKIRTGKGRPVALDEKSVIAVGLMQPSVDLMKEKKYDEVLSNLKKIEMTGSDDPEVKFFVQRMRAAVAYASGNDALFAQSMEDVVAANQSSPEDQMLYVQVLSYEYAKLKNQPKTIEWTSRYLTEGGTEPVMRTRLIHAYYRNNEFANAARELRADIVADEAAGKTPAQQDLRLLASAELKAGNKAGYNSAIEKSVTYYPKKEDWAELLNNVLSKQEFHEELGLDVYRLMYKTTPFTTSKDYMDMAQLALQTGYPAEAKDVLSKGFKAGILGNGGDAVSQKQLLKIATQRAAVKPKALAREEAEFLKTKDGGGLAQVGYVYVTNGEYEKGIKLIEQGVAIGGMKRPDIAKLHLGIAKALAGRNGDAIQTLKTVQGMDGTADLARSWTIYLSSLPTS